MDANSTREAWLHKAVEELQKGVFKHSGYRIPKLSLSVGFAYASRGTKRIGQCWAPQATADGKAAILICPTVGDAKTVLSTLVHEVVHAVVGCEAKHGPIFRKAAKAVGLDGPMRSTMAGPKLTLELQAIVAKLGAYPHGKINLSLNSRPKQTTRLYKMDCPECGYIVRSTRKYILFSGPVYCPCNFEPMRIDPTLTKEDLTPEEAYL